MIIQVRIVFFSNIFHIALSMASGVKNFGYTRFAIGIFKKTLMEG